MSKRVDVSVSSAPTEITLTIPVEHYSLFMGILFNTEQSVASTNTEQKEFARILRSKLIDMTLDKYVIEFFQLDVPQQ